MFNLGGIKGEIMKKKLAKISKARLEIQERGILMFWIYVDYEEGGCQGVGGIALDDWDEGRSDRVGTAFGCEVIRRLLLALDVNDFSEMTGKMVWVLGEGDGFGFETRGIQALKVDDGNNEPVLFSEIHKEFYTKEYE